MKASRVKWLACTQACLRLSHSLGDSHENNRFTKSDVVLLEGLSPSQPGPPGLARLCLRGKVMTEKIFYWPDGCWCRLGDFEKMSHKSSDFGLIEVSLTMSDEKIDELVDALVII